MKVAFATSDGSYVDEHFGWCHSFLIYDIKPEKYELIGYRYISENEDNETNKIEKRIEAIKDCVILYCTSIGAPAAARIVQRGIHPLKATEPELIDNILRKLITVLKAPPLWLNKILEREKMEV